MAFAGFSRADWHKLYGQFERIALGAVLLVLSLIIVYALIATVIKLMGDFALGELFLDKAALQDTFGLVLTVVILLEFNHSIYVALAQRSGAIQTQSVVLIVILVIARKLMLKDIDALDLNTLLGFGGLLLALGALYWLIAEADRRRARATHPNPEPANEPPRS